MGCRHSRLSCCKAPQKVKGAGREVCLRKGREVLSGSAAGDPPPRGLAPGSPGAPGGELREAGTEGGGEGSAGRRSSPWPRAEPRGAAEFTNTAPGPGKGRYLIPNARVRKSLVPVADALLQSGAACCVAIDK